MNTVFLCVVCGVGLGIGFELYIELHCAEIFWYGEEAGECVSVCCDESTNVGLREAPTEWSTGKITEVQIDEDRADGFVFLEKGTGFSTGYNMFVCEL
jgi:hypothetical protein